MFRKKKFTKVFFTTDLHGSDVCFRKFLSVPKYYGADVLILGGDLTGKIVVTTLKQSDGTWRCEFPIGGKERVVKTESEVEELEKNINFASYYSCRIDAEEWEELTNDEKRMHELFQSLSLERLKEWIRLAEERLKPIDVKCYVTGGNDDEPIIEPILNSGAEGIFINAGERLLKITDYNEMISTGYGNMTPWNCPRDITEEQLERKIEDLASKVENMDTGIFNFHVPPIASGLDTCPKLDTSVTPPKIVTDQFTAGGSVAVRKAIEHHQPLLGLHGHIHEGRDVTSIGRTLCINPGSEHGEGILRGALITLDEKGRIKAHQFTSG